VIAAAMGPDGDLVAARLARGCRCFGAWLGGELAGYGWLSVGHEWIGELELAISPGAAEGYIWNCFVLPRHRRKGVFSALLASVRTQGRDDGLRRVWIGSVAIPAEKAFGGSGFKPALLFETVRLPRLRWMRVSAAPGADPSFVNEARKVIGPGGELLRLGSSLRRSHPRRH
jgi:GNAT superfamily N-acetyltransferase